MEKLLKHLMVPQTKKCWGPEHYSIKDSEKSCSKKNKAWSPTLLSLAHPRMAFFTTLA